MMRGAGARDLVTGLALLYTVACDGNYRPWLAMRAAADAADAMSSCSGAWRAGEGSTSRPPGM